MTWRQQAAPWWRLHSTGEDNQMLRDSSAWLSRQDPRKESTGSTRKPSETAHIEMHSAVVENGGSQASMIPGGENSVHGDA